MIQTDTFLKWIHKEEQVFFCCAYLGILSITRAAAGNVSLNLNLTQFDVWNVGAIP